MIESRLDAGEYPYGGMPFYSKRELKIPSIIVPWRGPTHEAAWRPIQERMISHSEATNWGIRYGEREWVLFEKGYWEFRRVAGMQASVVDLNLTGKMREDLNVKWDLTQSNGKVIATVSGKKGQVKGTNIAHMSLEIGWDTLSSETVAYYIENGDFPRPFAFWTDSEQAEITRTLADYIARYDRLHEGNTGGRFQPVGF